MAPEKDKSDDDAEPTKIDEPETEPSQDETEPTEPVVLTEDEAEPPASDDSEDTEEDTPEPEGTNEPVEGETPEAEPVVGMSPFDKPEAFSDTAEKTPPPPVTAPVPSKGLHPFIWALLGSAVAIVVLGGIYTIETRPNGLFDNNSAAVADLSARLDATTAELDALKAGLSDQSQSLATATDSQSAMSADLAAQSERISELAAMADTLATYEQRLTDLENRPIPDVGATQDAVDAYERELTAMREMLAAELENIRTQTDQTAAIAEQAVQADQSSAARAISADLQDAIEAGRSLTPILEEAQSEGLAIPDTLAANATSLPSLASLQSSLSEAAREIVADDVRNKAASGEIGRIEAFFRLQLGARSLNPGDGDNPEQVMARAETSIGKGDVEAALAEAQALDPASGTALATWIASATQYVDAMTAAANISTDTQ